jgi:hypothetical protein
MLSAETVGFWCIWGFWAGEDSLADGALRRRQAHMPCFKLFPVADKRDGRRVCHGASTCDRRCTRTRQRLVAGRHKMPVQLHFHAARPLHNGVHSDEVLERLDLQRLPWVAARRSRQ